MSAVTRPAYGEGSTSVSARSASDYVSGYRLTRTGDVWAAERALLASIDAKHAGDLHGGLMTAEELAYYRAAFAKRCAADEEDEYDGPFDSQEDEDDAYERHQHLAERAKREGEYKR